MGSQAEVQDRLTADLVDDPVTTFRILVADDDEGIRELLRTYLSNEGFAVETARTGQEALAFLEDEPPDVLLLDVEMPGVRGLDVLRSIRDKQVDAAVIITTAYGSEDIVAEALRGGADDYLRKPFAPGDLQAVVDRTTARLLLRRQNAALRSRVEHHKRHMENELAKAAQVVSELLPIGAPPLRGFELAAVCLSSRDVGGDFYDWIELGIGEFGLTVGDVMGKGISAALLMATARAILRTVVTVNSPAGVVQWAARALESDLTRAGAFITLFHAQLDLTTGDLRYVDAGHGYVLLRRASGAVEELKPWGLPIGVDPAERYRAGLVCMNPGDTLVIYSDGLGEARPDLFNDRESVAAFVARSGDPQAVVQDVKNAVAHIRPLPDDLTIVVLRRQRDAAIQPGGSDL